MHSRTMSRLSKQAYVWIPVACGLLAAGGCVREAREEAQLSWSAPIERVDGSALERVESYRIAWGPQSGGPYASGERLVDAADVAGDDEAGRASATVRGLEPGRWCFVVYAVDGNGVESPASGEACKEVGRKPAGSRAR